MNDLSIWINDLNLDQRDQIFDLLTLVGIRTTVLSQPNQNTYSIEIGLNKTNARLFEGILSFIITYITQGEQHDYSDNE